MNTPGIPKIDAMPSRALQNISSHTEQANLFITPENLLCKFGNVHTFQTFDDSSSKRNLARIFHGEFEQHKADLGKLNKEGAGIFFTVNETDGKGRTKSNITKVRAVFVDLDGAPLEPVQNALVKPHIIIESSPDKYHAYWFVSDCSLDQFKSLQQALAIKFGGDASVCDLPRVMRLPGFYHIKDPDSPFLTSVKEINNLSHYNIGELIKELKLELKLPTKKEQSESVETTPYKGVDDPHALIELKRHVDKVRNAEKGIRNTTLNQEAFFAYGLSKAGRLSEDDVTEDLHNAALETGLSAEEINGTLKSAKDKANPIHNPIDKFLAYDNKTDLEKANTTNWQVPISLESAKLPPWADDIFPERIQNFATALSSSTETPPELSAMMVLAAISAASQGKYRVRVKPDYFEPVNIWACAALPPGSRKTAVQMAATAPLTTWEKLQREKLEPEIKEAQANDATIREQVNLLRKKASKAEGAEFEQLKEEIAGIETALPEIPKAPQIWAQDVTPENLGTIMADNDERMAILSDEAGIFDILGGRYSGGIPNLDLFLKGHAGSPVRVNRGSRLPVFMQSPNLTMGLSPQPDVLRGLTEKPSFRGRGLLGRFLYVLPTSNLGYRTLDASPMFPGYIAEYEVILTAILNQEMASNDQGEPCPHILKITDDAMQSWQTFAHKIEAGMREGGAYAHLTDWAGKLPGAAVRIAALLHIARHAFARPWDKQISIEDMGAALRMADILSAHALVVFDLMGADPALDGARVVLRWIEREGKPEFTFRNCHHAHKTRYKRAADLEPAIDVLMERHFIRQRLEKVPYRPSRILEVNPTIFSGY